MSTYKYIVDILAKNGQFVSSMNQNVKKLDEMDKKVKSAQNNVNGMMDGMKKFAGAVGIAFGVSEIVAWGKESVKLYSDGAQAETALLIALKGRRDVQENLIVQAKQLMGTTLFDDDDTIRAQSLLAAFVKEESQIKRLIPTIQDFASAKQTDLASATDMVTRTLNGEMEAIGRTGIKVHGAAGSAERLTSIIKGLNDAYGGQAQAAARVGTGSLVILGHAYEDLRKVIGGLIISQQNQSGSFAQVWTKNIQSVTGFADKVATISQEGHFNFIQSVMKAIVTSDAKVMALKEHMAEVREPDVKPDSLNGLLVTLQNLNAELAAMSATDVAGIKVQKEKIKNVTEQIKALQSVGEVAAETNKYQAGTVGALGEELTKLNEQLANANANDIASIQIIGAKIAALTKYQEAVKNISSDPSSFRKDKFSAIGPVSGKAQVKGSEDPFNMKPKLDASDFTANASRIKDATQIMQDQLDATREKVKAVQDAFASGFDQIGQSVLKGLGLAQTGFEGFVSGLAETAIKLISMMLAESIANSIAGATMSGTATGPAAIFTTPAFIATAIGGVLGAFASIPAFATGGIVPGSSMYGDKMMIRANSGEEVLTRNDPRHRMNGMFGSMGGSGSPTVVLQPSLQMSGDKIRVMLNRVDKNLRKRT